MEVSALRIAPVKALASVTRDQVLVGPAGVAEDRRLFLVRQDGSVATMRRFPELTRVVPDLDLAGGSLLVALPDGGGQAASPLEPSGDRLETVLFGKRRAGSVVAGAVSEALSTYVGEPLRVVLADGDGVGWDEGPVSLLGHASVAAVEPPRDPHGPDIARFRMLVELIGGAPFEEDSWVGRSVALGGARFRITHPLGRCAVVDYRPSTGERDWSGVASLLQRRGRGGSTLGVIGEVETPGVVAVGDRVVVPA